MKKLLLSLLTSFSFFSFHLLVRTQNGPDPLPTYTGLLSIDSSHAHGLCRFLDQLTDEISGLDELLIKQVMTGLR